MVDILWYYAQAGQQRGPVSTEALARMIAENQLAPTDLVWREGMADWQPAANFPELCIGPAFAGSKASRPAASLPYQGHPAPGSVGQSFASTATTAFVLSLIGLACCGPVLGVISIVLATNALNGMHRSGNFDGKGLANAGRIIGIIDLCFWALVIVAKVGARGHGFRF
jgi:hypothetical protein